MRKWTPAQDESFDRSCVDLLRQRRFEEIEKDLDPTLVDSNTRTSLAEMAAVFPVQNPESIKVVALSFSKYTTDITLEYQFPSKWLVAQIATRRSGNRVTVTDFHVTPIPDSVENLNRFTLVGKGFVQYSMLAFAVCSLLFSFYVFILCIRTPKLKMKWLWALAVLVGAGKFAVNWTSGEWTFNLLSVQIPSARVTGPLYGPFTLAVVLPLGAALFLNHRWKMKVSGELIPPSPNGPE